MYQPEADPFQDTVDDELIGVSFVYLDSLQYLLDIKDSYCIANYQGFLTIIIDDNVSSVCIR